MRFLLVLLAMLSGLSLPGNAVAASRAQVVAASVAEAQAQERAECPVRAAVAKAAFRIERASPAFPPAPVARCGVIVSVDRARE
jgi:hypothetical protein